MYNFSCENCSRFFGSQCQECQHDKRIQKQSKHRRYQHTLTSTNWTSYKFGECFKCGKVTQLNRFGMCVTCYERTCDDNIEGDFLYTDNAISDLDQLIGGIYSEEVVQHIY